MAASFMSIKLYTVVNNSIIVLGTMLNMTVTEISRHEI